MTGVLVPYRAIAAVLAVAIFFTNFDIYFQFEYLDAFPPRNWLFLYVAACAPFLLTRSFLDHIRLTPIVFWCFGYALLSILGFFISSQSAITFQDLRLRVLSLLFLMVMMVVLTEPVTLQVARLAVAAFVLFGIAINLFELFNPLTFSSIVGRSAGLYLNPNQSGAALVVGMIVANGAVPSHLRLPFILLTGIGVFVTFSRAAILGWIVVVTIFAVQAGLSLKGLVRLGLVVTLTIGFLFSPWWGTLQDSLSDRGVLTTDVLDRLAFFKQGNARDDSAEERSGAAQEAWEIFAANPLVGTGTGSSYEAPFEKVPPHDTYLAEAVNHGVIGFLVLPLLVLASVWGARGEARNPARVFAAFCLMWGIFSHNVLEERYLLLSFSLIAAMSTLSRNAVVPVERPSR